MANYTGRGRAKAANHAIVTTPDQWPISEFLIVGCQHGWLTLVTGGFNWPRFVAAHEVRKGLPRKVFLVRILLLSKFKADVPNWSGLDRRDRAM